jgi:hypothetical protein
MASVRSPSVLKTLSPSFDFGVQFQLSGGRLSQYVLHVSIVQRTGFWRRRYLLLAEAFCSIPLLDLFESMVLRWYTLVNMSTSTLNAELSEEFRSQNPTVNVD